MEIKAAKRSAAKGAPNMSRELESRILSIIAHALVEGVVNYGLSVARTHGGQRGVQSVKGGIVGAGPAGGRNMLNSMADARTLTDHFGIEAANMMDRVLHAGGASAQSHTRTCLRMHYHINSPNPPDIRNY